MARVHWSERPTDLIKHHRKVRSARQAPITEARTWLQLAINRPVNLTQGARAPQMLDANGIRDIGFSLLSEACHGANSQITKPLKAVVAPIGGKYEAANTAEGLGQWIDGVLKEVDFHAKAQALTFQGMLISESHAVIERDPVTKDMRAVVLDGLETFFSQDRTECITLRAVPRRWLKAAWRAGAFGKVKETADLEDVIDRLPNYAPDHITGVDVEGQFAADDTVAWYEGWTLPIGSEPGKHVVQVGKDVVLVDDKWEHRLIPIISSRWTEGYRGPSDGIPLGRTVGPFMAWEMELRHKMMDSLKAAVPWVIGPKDAKPPSDVPHQQIETDEDGNRIKVEFPPGISRDVKEMAKELHEDGLKAGGISQDAAAGEAPPRFESGVALAQWVSIVNTRLSRQHATYEKLWTDAARILVTIGPDTYGKGKKVNVEAAIGSDIIQQIDWESVAMPEGSYALSFGVVSALGDTTSQKLENLQIAKNSGVIDNPQMWLHLNIPDFKAEVRLLNGPRKNIMRAISLALSKAIVEPPLFHMQTVEDIAAGVKLTAQAYQAAISEVVPPEPRYTEALRMLHRAYKRDYAKKSAAEPTSAPAAASVVDAAPVTDLAPVTPEVPGLAPEEINTTVVPAVPGIAGPSL